MQSVGSSSTPNALTTSGAVWPAVHSSTSPSGCSRAATRVAKALAGEAAQSRRLARSTISTRPDPAVARTTA